MSAQARRARELIGLPVLSVAEGQHLGTITALRVRREARSVAAVAVGGGAFSRPQSLRFSDLQTLGADAAMVASAAILKHGVPPAELRELDEGLTGRAVITESGHRLGEIVDFTLDPASGRIETYWVRPDAGLLARLAALVKPETVSLPDALVVALGAHALIVRDEALSLFEREAPRDAAAGGAPAP